MNKLLFLKNLTNKYASKEIGKEFHFNRTYFYFILICSKSTSKIYTENYREDWIIKINNVSNFRYFSDYYKLVKFIGEGNFAKVCEAKNIITKETFAVKIIEKSEKNDGELLNLIKEIEILKYCNNTNIIKYIDYFEDNKNIYIIQEYMNNLDLINFLNNNSLSDDDIKNIIKQIFSPLYYLNNNNIIHRNIKPTNILINKNESITVKLSEFTLSKILRSNEHTTDRVGMSIFSPPEILLCKKYNNLVDIWSVGILIYFILFKKMPFDDELDDEDIVYRNIVNSNYKLLEDNLDYGKYRKLIFGCLQYDHDQRFDINYIFKNINTLLYS